MKNKYLSRITSSARGEVFNPLIWPSLLCTLVYGLGFAIFLPLEWDVGTSSLYVAMGDVGSDLPIIWGIAALVTIFTGLFFLLFNRPPMGKFSGLLGFMLWLFAGICYGMTNNWLVLAAIAFPNMLFWFWQYLSLSKFRGEDKIDNRTMDDYDKGGYDDELDPQNSKIGREDNRGVDRQSHGSYDTPDDGHDCTRPLDSDK